MAENKRPSTAFLIEKAYRSRDRRGASAFTASEIIEACEDARTFDGGRIYRESYRKSKGDTFKVTIPGTGKPEYYGIIFENNHFREIATAGRTIIFSKTTRQLVEAYPNLRDKRAVETKRDLREYLRKSRLYRNVDIAGKVYLELCADTSRNYDMVYGVNEEISDGELAEERILSITLKEGQMRKLTLAVSSDSERLIMSDKTKGYTVYPDGRQIVATEYLEINDKTMIIFARYSRVINRVLDVKRNVINDSKNPAE